MADPVDAHAHDNVADSSRSEPDQSLRLRTKPTTTDQEVQKQANKIDSSKKAESSTGFQADPKDTTASSTSTPAPAEFVTRYSCSPATAAWESLTYEQKHVHIYTPTPSPPSSPSRPDADKNKETNKDKTNTDETNKAKTKETNANTNEIETQQARIQSATLLGAERGKQVQMENVIYLLHGLVALSIIFMTAMVFYYPKFLGMVFGLVVVVMGVLLKGVWGWLSD